MKRSFCIFVTLILCIALTACSTSSSTPASVASTPAAGSSAAASSAPETPAKRTNWPTQDIKVICGYAPGGSNDIAARVTIDAINPLMTNGKQMFVENIAGASGTLGATECYNAKPDGNTLMVSGSGILTTTPLVLEVIYTGADITPIATLNSSPACMVVGKDVPFDDFEGWVEWCKANPGEFTYAVAGKNTPGHISALAVAQAYGIEIEAVFFNGTADGVAQMMGGHVMGSSSKDFDYVNYVDSGECKLIYVTNDEGIWGDCDAVVKNHGIDVPFTNSIYLIGPPGMDEDMVWDIYELVKDTFETELLKNSYKNVDMIPVLRDPDATKAEIEYLTNMGRDILHSIGVETFF